MKVLVTGGAGFIGSHLCEALLESGDEVYIIDDLSTGSMNNIEHLKNEPRFHYALDSIMNRGVMAELVDTCETVFHLAAAVGVKLIVESPVNTIETNVHGTEMVLQLAARKKRKVILASTSEVYGKSDRVPFSEADDMVLGTTTKARWSYACSKAVDEFLALAYYREKELPVVIARLFNTVGPRQTGMYGMVIPTLVGQALKGEAMTVFGSGKQTRSFTYVKDTVTALMALAGHEEAVGEVFNIGNNEEISIESLAHLIRDMTGSGSEIVYISYDQAYQEGFEDMMQRIPDIRKIGDLTGYKPSLGIKGILSAVIDNMKQQAS